MKIWIIIMAGGVPGALFLLLSIIVLRCLWRRHQVVSPQVLPQISEVSSKSKISSSIHGGISKLHLSYKSGSSARKSLRFHPINHQHPAPSSPPASHFSWDEHPRLITEAVESGWPRFAFCSSTPDAFCAACDGGTQRVSAESGLEVPPGSSEFMQTVRLNAAAATANRRSDNPSFSWVRTRLPLPGPALGGGAFPQEAYFEITILYLESRKKLQLTASKGVKNRECDDAKLIGVNSGHAAAGIVFASQDPDSCVEKGSSGDVAVSLGLICHEAALPGQSMPGNFPGSIGFHSDGSIYLDGRKLVFGSDKAGWACINRVIGCGFEPSKKKVFFTVDSKLAHVIRCTSEAYSSPLYPVLAADADTMLLVNLGQAPFKYAPANSMRTSNPCFLRLAPGVAAGGLVPSSVDSRELFSMSRMEAEWLEHDKRCNHRTNSSSKSIDNLDDSLDGESDLFEISLQS